MLVGLPAADRREGEPRGHHPRHRQREEAGAKYPSKLGLHRQCYCADRADRHPRDIDVAEAAVEVHAAVAQTEPQLHGPRQHGEDPPDDVQKEPSTLRMIEDLESMILDRDMAIDDLESMLADRDATVADLARQLSDARARIGDLEAQLAGAVNEAALQALSSCRSRRASRWSSAIRRFPGATPLAQLQNIMNSVLNLNQGRKQGVYQGLGGR